MRVTAIEGLEAILPLPSAEELSRVFLDEDELLSAALSLLCDPKGLRAYAALLCDELAPAARLLTSDEARWPS